MVLFVSSLAVWYEQIRTLPTGVLVKLMAMGARVAKFVSGGG